MRLIHGTNPTPPTSVQVRDSSGNIWEVNADECIRQYDCHRRRVNRDATPEGRVSAMAPTGEHLELPNVDQWKKGVVYDGTESRWAE